ncbi:MAG: O-antigen ligase family protein [Actinobacteria bacterium]|nr:O-antigen ligase family protein [Actinomycetota bacterium]
MSKHHRMDWIPIIDWKSLLMLYLAVLLLIPVELYRVGSGLPVDVQLDRIVVVLISFLWLASLLVDIDTGITDSSAGVALLSFVGVAFLSFALNISDLAEPMKLADAFKRLLYVFSMALIFYLILSTIKRRDQVNSVLKFGVSLAAFVGALGVVEFLTGFNFFRNAHEVLPFLTPSLERVGNAMFRGGHLRVVGSASHPIALGVLLSMFLPLALHYFEFASSLKERARYGLSIASVALAILLTISRTPLIAIAAMLAVYSFYKPSRALRFGLLLLLAAFIVYLVFPNIIDGLVKLSSLSFLEQNELFNPNGRVADYPRILSFFIDKPLYGHGYGWWNNNALFYVDNQYLKVLVELGALGLVALICFFRKLAVEIWRASAIAMPEERDLLVSILASCAAYIVTLATYDSFGFTQVTYVFFVIAALGVSLAGYVRSQRPVSDSLVGS